MPSDDFLVFGAGPSGGIHYGDDFRIANMEGWCWGMDDVMAYWKSGNGCPF